MFPAFELFLTSLVRQEMSQMPRGIYFSALRGGNLRSDRGKTVAGIPSFMLKTYEKNKQPGLKPGLAGDPVTAHLAGLSDIDCVVSLNVTMNMSAALPFTWVRSVSQHIKVMFLKLVRKGEYVQLQEGTSF